MQMLIVLAFTYKKIIPATLVSIDIDGYRIINLLLMQMLVLGQTNHAFTSASHTDETCDSTRTPWQLLKWWYLCNGHLQLGKRNPSPPVFYVHPKTTHPFAIQKQVHSEVHGFVKNDLFVSVQNLKYSAVNVVFMNAGWAKAGITCTKHRQTPGVISGGRLFFLLLFHFRII